MLGLAADFCAIFIGSILGNLFFSKRKISSTFSALCGIIISMMSIVGFITSMIYVEDGELNSPNLMISVICLVVGTLIGEFLDLENKIYNSELLKKSEKLSVGMNSFMTGIVMFAVGGMAIVGPMEAFVKGDNSTLYLKALIDFTIALSLGGALGKVVGLSAFPVSLIQWFMGITAYLLSGFFTDEVIDLFCCVGYVILFFSGFNFIFDKIVRIKTVNMIPAVFFVFVIGGIKYILIKSGVLI